MVLPRQRSGPPRSIRRPTGGGEPDPEARARALNRLRNGPSALRESGRVDWGAVTIAGAVLAGILVLSVLAFWMVGV